MKIKKIEYIKLDKEVPVYNLTINDKSHTYPISVGNNKYIWTKNCDEINEKSVDEAIDLLNTLDNRFASRFSGSNLVFQTVVSSARTTNSPMGEYIKRLPKNDPSIIQFNPKLYEVKTSQDFVGDGRKFWVQAGNGSIPSKIITDPGELQAIADDKYEVPTGCVLFDVPEVYRSKFEMQLDQSIQDIAGIVTYDDSLVFRDTTKIEDIRLPTEITLNVDVRDNVRILNMLEPYKLFTQDVNGKWSFIRAPYAEHYCHCDLAGSGDGGQCDASICIGHKEWRANEITGINDVYYVVDMLFYFQAKTKVDINAIQQFLIDLVRERGLNIHTVTADQWQSLMFLQNLEKSGCFKVVKQLSVDVKLEPYTNAATLIEKGHVKAGLCPKLRKELEALVLNKGKVTRTTELKDAADSLVGFIYNAQLNYVDVPVYEYKTPEEEKEKPVTYHDFIQTDSEDFFDLI